MIGVLIIRKFDLPCQRRRFHQEPEEDNDVGEVLSSAPLQYVPPPASNSFTLMPR